MRTKAVRQTTPEPGRSVLRRLAALVLCAAGFAGLPACSGGGNGDSLPARPNQPKPSGPSPAPALPAAEANGNAIVNRGGGFVWKPVSSSDGKLVVLLPAWFTGKTVTSSSGIYIDAACTSQHALGDGRYAGVHNDNREHFRFPAPGSAYTGRIWFSVQLQDGTRVLYPIEDAAKRVDL